MLNTKIINGQVFDGTGSAPKFTDIGLSGDTIQDVGDLAAAEADTTIDAAGKIVCPGFIDVHSHSDAYLLIEPSAHSKLYQGITTEIVGNCGASAAPLVGEYHMPSDWRDKEYPGTWSSVAEYRSLLEDAKPAPNVVLLIGHGTLRVGIVGYENRPVTKSELTSMASLLEQSMEEGGRGLSSGLIYTPAASASKEELVELAKVAERYDGIYTSHMRSEGARLIEAIEETVDIGRQTGIRTEISHLKVSGKANWRLIDDALATIENAQSEGLEVAADRYPYTAAGTDLDVILPAWAAEGGRDCVLARLRDKGERARLREDLLESISDDYWSGVTIGSTSHPDNHQFQGKPLTEVAAALDMTPVDAALHLIDTDELKTGAFFSGMSEDNMMRILNQSYVMLGSDASLRSPSGPLSKDHPHPRAYGSFPRFLRMALDGRSVPIEEAIRKMTSLPAAHFRLADRGVLAVGKKADIIVVDPDAVRDNATYGCPHKLATGIEHVVVNGVSTLTEGKLTGNRSGMVL